MLKVKFLDQRGQGLQSSHLSVVERRTYLFQRQTATPTISAKLRACPHGFY